MVNDEGRRSSSFIVLPLARRLRVAAVMVTPSCPALVIHDDDAFRKSLIAVLDQRHFTVTFVPDGPEATRILESRHFAVILLGLNLDTGSGMAALDYLQNAKRDASCAVLLLGDPDPRIRTKAPWVAETLLKPVDPEYVAKRAQTYCDCSTAG